jgi:IclR family acetate operon transcriptional repressor
MSKRENISGLRKYSTQPGKPTTVTTSLNRATVILSCLSNDINTVTDIASYCRFSTSTVHRLLQSLKELNWAIQDENNHRYYLGPLVTQLSSNQMAAHRFLVMQSLREMIRLSDITEETVNLSIMVKLHYTLLHEIPSDHGLRITTESKRLGPFFIGATAKVLLSQLNDEELKTTLKHLAFTYTTEKTVTDKHLLMEQIMEIRRQGYCITYGERISGAVCISAPIGHYLCPASISIVGPEDRLGPKVDEVVAELKASAGRITRGIARAFN